MVDLVTLTHQIALSLHRVGLAGAAVDLPAFHKLGKKWRQEAASARSLLLKYAHKRGMKTFSPTVDEDIRVLLYQKMRLPVLEKTAKDGKPAVAKPTLLRLLKEEGGYTAKQLENLNGRGNLPEIEHLITFNRADKLASTWYGSEVDKKKKRKSVGELIVPVPDTPRTGVRDNIGLLHFWIFSLRTRTGRRASGGGEDGDPESRNSQNWPPVARKVIVSRWAKGKIAVCDFSRLEVVLVGWRAKDEKLLDYFLNGSGYIGVAEEFWGQKVVKDTALYKATKSLVLGLDYNMGFYKLAMDLWHKADFKFSNDWKTHVARTKEARKKYLGMFPGLQRYIRDRISEMRKSQQVVSPTGRIRHLPHHGEESRGYWHLKNMAVNYPIQSFASDVTGSALVDYEDALLREHKISYVEWHKALLEHPWDLPCSPVVNECHDELDQDLHPQTGKRDLEILVDCMRNVRTLKKLVPEFDLKLNVEVELGDTWY